LKNINNKIILKSITLKFNLFWKLYLK